MKVPARSQAAKPIDIAFPPSEYAALEKEFLKNKRTGKSILVNWGIPSIDALVNPLEAGDLACLQGRPGNGKSAVLNAIARQRAKFLAANIEKYGEKRVVAYVTGEQTVEELSAFHTAAETHIDTRDMKRGTLTDGQWSDIEKTIDQKIDSHLWFFGYSSTNRRKHPRMTIQFIIDALIEAEAMYDIKYDLVILDYLQVFPLDKVYGGKVEDTTDFLVNAKQGTYITGAPWIIGAQTAAEVDARKDPIPQQGDVEWVRGAASQIFDTMVSVTRPIKYVEKGAMFGKKNHVVTNELLIFACLKQKLGEVGVIPLSLDPRYNWLNDAEEKHYQAKGDSLKVSTRTFTREPMGMDFQEEH